MPSLALFRTHWGAPSELSTYFAETKAAAFDGVEAPVPEGPAERAAFHAALQHSGLLWIAEVCTLPGQNFWTPQSGTSVKQHLDDLTRKVAQSLAGPTAPLFINTMAGLDSWRYKEAVEFHTGVVNLQAEVKVPISVETHRGRTTFNPWTTRDLLIELPDLRLTADLSHWCVVAERLLLEDPCEVHVLLPLLARHVHHIQPRVGYAQGPQVPDPRAPEHAGDVAAHERWWDVILDGQLARGAKMCTMTPEFGPAADGYMQSRPYTREPCADPWVVNQWIGHRQRQRFNKRTAKASAAARHTARVSCASLARVHLC
jgi:sugar phosphate isomerase/epimerase